MRTSSFPLSLLLVMTSALLWSCGGSTHGVRTEQDAASGGSHATGGTTSSGGLDAAGGMTSTGGTAGADGGEGSGGGTSSGGTTASGGVVPTGGVTATGGTTANGGTTTIATGGTTVTDGAMPTGGTPATGGATSRGGATGRGGATVDGGATGEGGTTGTADADGGSEADSDTDAHSATDADADSESGTDSVASSTDTAEGCESTCRGLCESCDLPGKEGICSPREAGSQCRAAIAPCDVEERCDGVSGACPDDMLASSEAVCDSWDEIRCASEMGCGASIEGRSVERFCSGESSLCDGTTDATPWSAVDACGTGARCLQSDTGRNAQVSCSDDPLCDGRCVVRVSPDGSDSNGGESWTDAKQSPREAIATAKAIVDKEPAVQVCEVWVATGTYKPGNSSSDTFALRPGVHLYGGFAGHENDRDERDFVANKTILSGDHGAAGCSSTDADTVVRGADDAIIDGFTITGNCYRNSPGGGNRSAMTNVDCSPVVRNCTFHGNISTAGGAMYNENASTVIESCTFTQNLADSFDLENSIAVYARGGAIRNVGSSPTITNCVFSGNAATVGGVNWSDLDVGYRTRSYGGAIYNDNSVVRIANSVFLGNLSRSSAERRYPISWQEAFAYGGAIYNTDSTVTVLNCTFTRNTAEAFEVIHSTNYRAEADSYGGAIYTSSSGMTVDNAIFWHNSAQTSRNEIFRNGGTVSLNTSVVEGGYAGTGNLDADPLFVNANAGNLRVTIDSPCIDSGSNDALLADTTDLDRDGDTAEVIPWDLDRNDRIFAGTVDIGAYENRVLR